MLTQVVPIPDRLPALFFILAGNAVPLAGVLFWGWDVFELMFLYWGENVIIGLFTLLMMLAAGLREGVSGGIAALFMGAFFTLHYGMFCMGHGVFVLALFYPDSAQVVNDGGLFAPIHFVLESGLWRGFFWAMAGIAIAQAVQMVLTWQSMDDRTLGHIMMTPYARIIVLHITLIFGGMAAMALDQPVAALVVLILLKTGFDLGILQFMRKDKT